MIVTLTPRAEADLVEIGDYIAQDNPGRALTFVQEVRAHCLAIADAPKAYAPRPELGRGIRWCPHGNYLILFRARRGEVLIVRVLHAARDVRQVSRRGLTLSEPPARYVAGRSLSFADYLMAMPLGQ